MALRVHGGTFSFIKVCQGHGSMVPQMHVFFFLRTNAIFFLRTNQALIEFTACTAFALLQRMHNEQSHPVSLANPTGLCVLSAQTGARPQASDPTASSLVYATMPLL